MLVQARVTVQGVYDTATTLAQIDTTNTASTRALTRRGFCHHATEKNFEFYLLEQPLFITRNGNREINDMVGVVVGRVDGAVASLE